MSDFRQFQSFFTIEEALDFASVLKNEGIDVVIETDPALDPSIGGVSSDKKHHLKIRLSDFEKVDSLFEKEAENSLTKIGDDYYLFSFTEDELIEILEKPDEWNKQDYVLAKQILKNRGKDINDDELKNLKKQRLNQLSKPENGMNVWVVIGYISSICGGLFGIFIGSALTSTKKTLPTGEIIHVFDERSRKHGKIILVIGVAVLIISSLTLLYYLINP